MQVRSIQPFAFTNDAGTIVVITPDLVFDDTDPVVLARRDWFAPVGPVVEQATAGPGEVRATRRNRQA